jgi:hypothetical protein
MPKIDVSEETYEKIKNQLQSDEFDYYENYVIIRSKEAGCFAAVLKSEEKDTVFLDHATRLHYWDGACSLSQLAREGVKAPKNCRFSVETFGHKVLGVVEIIPTTKEAQKNIRNVPKWKI